MTVLFWTITAIIALAIGWNIHKVTGVSMDEGYGHLAAIAILIFIEAVMIIAWFICWAYNYFTG